MLRRKQAQQAEAERENDRRDMVEVKQKLSHVEVRVRLLEIQAQVVRRRQPREGT